MDKNISLREVPGSESADGPAKPDEELKRKLKDADACSLIGAGVGAAGIVAAAAGAVCPFCVVAAPGLMGVGIFRRLYLTFARRRPQRIENKQEPK